MCVITQLIHFLKWWILCFNGRDSIKEIFWETGKWVVFINGSSETNSLNQQLNYHRADCFCVVCILFYLSFLRACVRACVLFLLMWLFCCCFSISISKLSLTIQISTSLNWRNSTSNCQYEQYLMMTPNILLITANNLYS
jgi:hypothetical protein